MMLTVSSFVSNFCARTSKWICVMRSFICTGCLNPVISTGHIGASAHLEVVDKFCYLCDMLSMEGDADAAVECGCQNPNWME